MEKLKQLRHLVVLRINIKIKSHFKKIETASF